MGSITPCRIIGSLEPIDEGETDHKIMCIALTDPDASKIFSLEDLDRINLPNCEMNSLVCCLSGVMVHHAEADP